MIALTLGGTPAISFAQDSTGQTTGTTTDDNDGFDWGWLGLLGLLGLMGRKKRDIEVDRTTTTTGTRR